MDILTQYYNEGGQIISSAPGMDGASFYQNSIFTHAFNEMFAPSNENGVVGWYQNENGIYIDCSNWRGGNPTDGALPGGSTPRDGKYTFADGLYGKKAIKPVPYFDSQGLSKAYLYVPKFDSFRDNINGFRIRLVVKNPYQTTYSDENGEVLVSLRSSEYESIDLCLQSFGKHGFISAVMGPSNDEAAGAYDLPWEKRLLLVDGEWHTYDLIINYQRKFQFSVDGAVVGEQRSGDYYKGNLTNPYVIVMLYTANDDLNFLIDSISIGKL